MNTLFLLFSTLLLGVNCVVIRVKNGEINGAVTTTKEGSLFHKFLSIPYAKPPVNELRFQPPVPVENWSGIKDATQKPPICIQKALNAMASALIQKGKEQEDCLYLNVYVPDEVLRRHSSNTPVIVGIHGGGFQSGSSNDFAGDYFMERDVIFVTINYRLGVLGFLAVNDFSSDNVDKDLISGNFGLKDQNLALKWVKENIARFGGDPANVTLLGESAGSASVHFHMFSPLSKGLFQKAIMESGNVFSPWSHYPAAFKVDVPNKYLPICPNCKQLRLDQLIALRLLNQTKCLNQATMLKCLQKTSINDLTAVSSGEIDIPFMPTIELGVSEGKAFLPNEPNESNYQTVVPWLTGMNSAEAAILVPAFLQNGSNFAKVMNSNRPMLFPLINFYLPTANKEHWQNMTNKVIEFYFGTEDIGLETAQSLVEMITDSSWLYPLKKAVKSGPELQYVYLFDHRGSFSVADDRNITADLGVAHADELPMLFRFENLEAKRSLEDRRVSDKMLKYWINFAISGDPNRHSIEKVWQPVQTKEKIFEYLHIKSNGEVMASNLYQSRYDFWESLPTGW